MPIRLSRSMKIILLVLGGVFLVQQTGDRFLGTDFVGWFGLNPTDVVLHGRVWQLVTYAFLHGDVMHLALNLLMLVFIGGELEATWGVKRFLRFGLVCSVAAGLGYLLLQGLSGPETLRTPLVGSSGAIYGMLVAYGILFGDRMMLFMMLFPMKAKHFVWVLAGVEFFSTVFSNRGPVAGVAHIGGMVAGFLYLWGAATLRIRGRAKAQQVPTPKKRPNHLKLVVDNPPNAGGPKASPTHPEGGSPQGDSKSTPKTWH